jgi:hypothetical protein
MQTFNIKNHILKRFISRQQTVNQCVAAQQQAWHAASDLERKSVKA